MNINQIIKNNFCVDSRILKRGDIFFDFLSNSKKINPYFENIIKKKPNLILSTRKLNYPNLIIIKNVKNAYLSLIKKKYQNIPNNLFAVTGTNGKTSVANFFYQLHILNKKSCANIGTLGYFYNKKIKKNNLTTPSNLDIFNFLGFINKKKINTVILEASSHGLDQGRLDGLKFKGVVFTNFTQDHLDYHKSMKSYLKAKLKIFNQNALKKANVVCNDDVKKLLIKNKICKKNFKYVLDDKIKYPLKIISIKPNKNKSSVKINFKNNIYIFNIDLVGEFQIINLFQSIVLALTSGLKVKEVFRVLKKIKPIKGRLNIIQSSEKIICLDYAHTPDGLKKVIETLKNHFNKNVNIVFGCGGNRDKRKRKKMGQVANKLCNKVIITNDNPRNENPIKITEQIAKYVKKAKIIHNRKLAINKGVNITKKNEVLLVAGKGHENYQIFKNKKIYFSDLKEIKNNLRI